MLQIMGKTGIIGRIILTTVTHRNVGLKPGLLFIYSHINLQPVVKNIYLGFHGITLDCFIL